MAQTFAMSSMAGRLAAPVKPRASRAQGLRVMASAAAPEPSKAERQLWFPGNKAPDYLDGSMPGDVGFDPLGLGSDPELLRWFQQAELVHSRTAMLGVAGILFPAIITKAGAANIPPWYDAGKVWLQEHPAFPFASILFVQILLTGWSESKRWADFQNPGSQADGSFLGVTEDFKGMANGYPGGKFFDPLGLSRGSESQLRRYQDSEIKNGRLAMVAFLGFVAQFIATGKGPIDNLADHLADPYHVTFANNGYSLPFAHPTS
ncbi:hypothetical protein WJX81_001110 [Elliptochloris bilobata]|uniref:Chlorophyll a-b binding protein, chloroplastic n=1 Tax=Elliptochloris bilobata TaxID=381761 RepID=A0AAW1RTK2_9CHLO